MTLGLVINPVAGMGGRVGLKGTDGTGTLEEALSKGAEPVTPGRTLRFLEALGPTAEELGWLTCSGPMGSDVLALGGLEEGTHFEVVFSPPGGAPTTPADTRDACRALLERCVDLIVFCGGDGTARDVHEAVGDLCPVLGIPSGVKMFSGIFALSPEAAAELLRLHLAGRTEVGDGDVVDVDEEAYRRGELAVHLHGQLRVVRALTLVQAMKGVTSVSDEAGAQEAIARYVLELLERDGHPLAILGAGTTVAAVARNMGVEKTPLGVDVARRGELLVEDASEADLLVALEGVEGARVIVSPIGAQGFLLGRGSQQISPEVLLAAGGPLALMVVATRNKLVGLPVLLVDTGDAELDAKLTGWHKVIVGYHEMRMVRVEAASAPGDDEGT